jgi:hypothetical protein
MSPVPISWLKGRYKMFNDLEIYYNIKCRSFWTKNADITCAGQIFLYLFRWIGSQLQGWKYLRISLSLLSCFDAIYRSEIYIYSLFGLCCAKLKSLSVPLRTWLAGSIIHVGCTNSFWTCLCVGLHNLMYSTNDRTHSYIHHIIIKYLYVLFITLAT